MLVPLLAVLLSLSPQALACLPSTAAEDGVDLDDEDCDGSLAIRRDYVNDLDSFATSSDFSLVNASIVADHIRLSPPSAMGVGSMSASLPVAWESGSATLVMRVTNIDSGLICSASLSWGTGSASTYIAVGYNELVAPVPLGASVTVSVSCGSAAGDASIDWLVLQNGTYDFPPAHSLEASFDTTAFPGGGARDRRTHVRG